MNPEIVDALARLSDLTDDELATLQEQIVSEFDRIDGESQNGDTVAALESLADAQDAVNAEKVQREAAAGEAEERARAARERMHPADSSDEGDEGEGETDVVAGDETDEAGETEEIDADGNPVPKVAVAASARRAPARTAPRVPAMSDASPRRPAGNTPRASGSGLTGKATLTVGQTYRGWTAGDEIKDDMDLAKLFTERIKTLGRGNGERVVVASLNVEFPEERRLGSDAVSNSEKIAAATSRQNIIASGGVCGPVNVDYSLLILSTDDEPIAAALPDFNADRGGLRFMQPPTFGQVGASGTTVWTEATDANPGGATKPVQTIACGTEEEVFVDAIPTRLKFGNMQARFFPEMVSANTALALANAARVRELNRLAKIATYSTPVSSGQLLGAARDLLATVDQAAAAYRYRSRLDPEYQLRALMPSWTLDLLRADLVRQLAHGDDADYFAVTNQQITAWFTARNINVTWFVDGQVAQAAAGGNPATIGYGYQGFGAQAAGVALNDWPHTLVWYLFAEGTFQRLDGGQMDLGIVRDSLLDSTNDYETFVEIFEGIAMRGFESLQIISAVRPNGASAAAIATASASIY
jgi:hypothetical protein